MQQAGHSLAARTEFRSGEERESPPRRFFPGLSGRWLARAPFRPRPSHTCCPCPFAACADHSLAIHSVLFNSFGGAYVRTRTVAERRTDARSDETCRKVVRYVVEPLQYFIRAALLGNLIASGPERSLAA